jgi:hypothetical protein
MGQPSTLGDPSLLGIGRGGGIVTLSWGGEGGEPRGLIVVGVGGKAEPAFLLILVPFCRSVGLRSSAARV